MRDYNLLGGLKLDPHCFAIPHLPQSNSGIPVWRVHSGPWANSGLLIVQHPRQRVAFATAVLCLNKFNTSSGNLALEVGLTRVL